MLMDASPSVSSPTLMEKSTSCLGALFGRAAGECKGEAGVDDMSMDIESPMESSSSSAPSGVSGGGLQQMAAGLTRRLSSNIGAAIRGSPPSKPSTSPGRELYRVNVNPGGLGLGLHGHHAASLKNPVGDV